MKTKKPKVKLRTKSKVVKKKIEEEMGKRVARDILEKTKKIRNIKLTIVMGAVLGSLVFTVLLLFLRNSLTFSIIFSLIIMGLFFVYFHFSSKMKEESRIIKMEDSFPDFLQLISSNLRAGMTIDKAILLSSRPEFAPLDSEILTVGKDIATGRDIEIALLDMSKRIKSEKIKKTILLIISGIKAGGNIAVLLEQTSVNMRERGFVEKRAASNVLMYVIFIFIAACVGAPILFSLSSILVETLTTLLAQMPAVEASANMPLTFTGVNISAEFVKYFTLIFIFMTNILASFILGLVSKGDEKQGLKYLAPMMIISIAIFFLVRHLLTGVVAGLIS